MSGVAVIRHLLVNDPSMSAVAADANIRAGLLPQSVTPPAIGISSISSVRRNTVSMSEPKTLVTERVQVTLLVHDSARGGNDYPALVTGMRLIRQACPNQTATINGVDVSAILPDTEGPDLPAEAAGIVSRSQDFRIFWYEDR